MVGLLLVGAVVGPVGTRAMGPLPACRYDDLLTSPRGYDDWSITLVDTILRVTQTYVPPDLVSVSAAGFAGDGRVRAILVDDLRALRLAAARAGAAVGIESAYRSYSEQQQVFDAWVRQYGYDRALKTPARPGHSEHQLGLAIDFRTDPPTTSGAFGSSAAGVWMQAHAWEYGFVSSYPKGASALTCYDAEPWHFRYVGRALAARIHASGLTPREYLWANDTTTVVPPPNSSTSWIISPAATQPAVDAGTPTPLPSSSAGASPTTVAPAPTVSPAVGATPGPTSAPNGIEPAVAAGAQPVLVLVAGITFALIIGGGWLASRRRRPNPGG
jgi:zinc D-Ala-D-Ala carboxypeptidase